MLKHKLLATFLPIFNLILLFFIIPYNSYANKEILIKINSQIVMAEVADTQTEMEKGLMFRTSLPENSGMLFVFPKAQIIKMWMKNTLIPLDMIFINAEGYIVSVSRSAVPESLDVIYSSAPAMYVLEVNGGYAESKGIKTGDKVDINL